MKEKVDTKTDKESLKQGSTSKSKNESLCNRLLSSEENVENADYQVIHDMDGEKIFRILETKKGFAAIIGDYKMTPTLETREQVENIVRKKDWELIMNVIGLINHLSKQNNGN